MNVQIIYIEIILPPMFAMNPMNDVSTSLWNDLMKGSLQRNTVENDSLFLVTYLI